MTDQERGIGDNSGGDAAGIAGDRLRSFIARIERLNEEKDAITDGVKDIFMEAKEEGYDTKVMRKIIARRKRDRAAVEEEEALMALYLQALE